MVGYLALTESKRGQKSVQIEERFVLKMRFLQAEIIQSPHGAVLRRRCVAAGKKLRKRGVTQVVLPEEFPFRELLVKCGLRPVATLSENSEYDEAKNEQGKLYSHIAEVEEILQHAVIVDESGNTDVVAIGCKVTVEGPDGKPMPTPYTIVGSQESDPMHGIISEESPFGKALIGKKEGETAVVEAPRGNIQYKVLKIER